MNQPYRPWYTCDMRDPHVQRLLYRLETSEDIKYVDPPEVRLDTDEFAAVLDKGVLAVSMKGHHATSDSARSVVERYLRNWEVFTEIQQGKGRLHFDYDNFEVIDRNPPPPGTPQVHEVSCTITVKSAVFCRATVVSPSYPVPPVYFTVTPDVEVMAMRYSMYRAGREGLLAMAYFSLTVLENSVSGKRRIGVARHYNVEPAVLKKLGELTSEKGDGSSARKMPRTGLVPLTASEKIWIEAAVKSLIERLGEHETNPSLVKLTMADLPPLE